MILEKRLINVSKHHTGNKVCARITTAQLFSAALEEVPTKHAVMIFDDIIEAVPPRDFRLGYQKRNIPRKISALRNQIIVQIFCRLNIAEGMLLKYDTESLIAFIIYSISSDVFSSDSDRRSEPCAIL